VENYLNIIYAYFSVEDSIAAEVFLAKVGAIDFEKLSEDKRN
jgi:hypothetical protein